MSQIERKITPEQEEVKRKKAELFELNAELAQWELELSTILGELYFFDREYFRVVGSLYVELDEIEAQIAEYQALFNGEDTELQQQAQEARKKAKISQENQNNYNVDPAERQEFKPSESIKKLYRSIARLVHPDLTTNKEERQFREQMMPLVNQAYESRDEEKLQELFDQIVENTRIMRELVSQENVSEVLGRTLRQIQRVKQRIDNIKKEITAVKESPMATLREHSLNLKEEGRDLLAEMAEKVKAEVDKKQAVLNELIVRAKSNLEQLFNS